MSKNGAWWAGRLAIGWAIALLGGGAAVVQAAPWDQLLTLRPVEADPAKTYPLSEDNGPWMIMACSFSGNQAEQQANALVLELRRKYKLPAYVFQKKFDFGPVSGQGNVDRYGDPLKRRYYRHNGAQESEEIAVLVGNYPTIDDPEGQQALEKLKYHCSPDCLKVDTDKPTNVNLAGLRAVQQYILQDGSEKKKRGPLGHSFITKNPLLPQDYFTPKGLDPMLVKANEGVEYCLLDCPGKYTVQVAHFTGTTVIKQDKVADIENGKAQMHSALAGAAEKAHRLTQALRMNGYEAYEFHDRYASIVTVGSFDSVGTPRQDGKIEINPQVKKIIDTFQAKPQQGGPGQPGGLAPQRFVGIPFDIQPIPVQVPKRSLSAAYARSAAAEPARRN